VAATPTAVAATLVPGSKLPLCPEKTDAFWTNCQGTRHWNNASYVGEFIYGKAHGKGTYTWPDGTKYVGEWRNDKPHGYGTQYDSAGNIVFQGQLVSDGPPWPWPRRLAPFGLD